MEYSRRGEVVPAAFFASVSVALFAISNFEIAETRESVLVVLGGIAAVWGVVDGIAMN